MRLSVHAFKSCLLSKASPITCWIPPLYSKAQQSNKGLFLSVPSFSFPTQHTQPWPSVKSCLLSKSQFLTNNFTSTWKQPRLWLLQTFFFLLPPQGLGKLTEGTCPSVRRRTSRSGPAKTLGGWAIVIPKTVWEEMEIGNKAEGMHTFLDTTRQNHFFGKSPPDLPFLFSPTLSTTPFQSQSVPCSPLTCFNSSFPEIPFHMDPVFYTHWLIYSDKAQVLGGREDIQSQSFSWKKHGNMRPLWACFLPVEQVPKSTYSQWAIRKAK